MCILTYDGVKEKEKTLLAMTSLTRQEFEKLTPYFAQAWDDFLHQEGLSVQANDDLRQRAVLPARWIGRFLERALCP